MEVPWANVNYASKVNSGGFDLKELASRFLFIMLLTCLLISPAAATAVDWKITPDNPSVGDTLKITGTAASGADVRAEVTFIKCLSVSNGRYQLSLKDLQIPDGKDNLFSVRADGVNNLHVGVTKLLTYNLNKDAVSGVVTISQGHVPAWTFDILIDGDALKGKSSVQLKITASQTLTADSKGKFSFSYDTSALPAGDFSIKIANQVKTIKLWPKGQKPPHADFIASPVQGVQPLKVQFTDKSTGSPNKWYWNFGDGKASTARNPAHIYKNAGKYTVSLTVWNAVGSDKITKTYLIYVKSKLKPPVADFSASPVVGTEPLKVTFTDKSKELPNKWYWNFGDGKASTAENPTHVYKNAGKYTVSLTVWNAAGSNKITKTYLIYVKSKLKPPVADFSASPVVGKVPLKVTFTDRSKGIVSWWKWDFGDGASSTKQSPSHTYKKAGKYTVSLTAGNPAGSNKIKRSYLIYVKKP